MLVVKILIVKSVVHRVNNFMPRLNSIRRVIFQLCGALTAERKTFSMIISWIPLCQFGSICMHNTSFFHILYLFQCSLAGFLIIHNGWNYPEETMLETLSCTSYPSKISDKWIRKRICTSFGTSSVNLNTLYRNLFYNPVKTHQFYTSHKFCQ